MPFRKFSAPPDLPRLGWRLAEAMPDGAYAMWTPSDGEEDFGASRTAALLDEIFALKDRLPLLACAALCRELGWVADDPAIRRVELPEEPMQAPVRRADGPIVCLSLGAEKGIRVHFAEGTAAALREAHLAELRDHLQALAAVEPAYQAQPEEPQPGEWWHAMRGLLTRMQAEGQPPQRIGTVLVGEDTALP